MDDTTPAAEAELRALYAARSPAERMRMATAMFGTVTRVTLAALRHEDPQREGVALRLALLERLYGDDLTASIRAAVAAYDCAGADQAVVPDHGPANGELSKVETDPRRASGAWKEEKGVVADDRE